MTDLPRLTPLSAQQQLAFGLPEPRPFAIADQVRFGEIDLLGHVNNVVYMGWFETLRTRYVMDLGLTSYNQAVDPRIVIRSAEIRYVKEVLRDEIYVVTARPVAYRRTSYTIAQEIWSGDLRARFSCVIVTLEPDGSARRALAPEFIDAIRAHGAVAET